MTFRDAVQTCFRKYLTFSGRAARSEFWYFFLFGVLGGVVFSFIDAIVFDTSPVQTAPGKFQVESNGPLASLFNLAVLIPSLSAGWRRMHDTGRSGLYLMYPLIVMIGIAMFAGLVGGMENLLSGNLAALLTGAATLVLIPAAIVFFVSPLLVLWWLTRPSELGANAYGPNPHEERP